MYQVDLEKVRSSSHSNYIRMTQEFRMAKGWSIFIYLFAPIIITLFAFLGIIPFMTEEFSLLAAWILVPVSAGMVAFMVYGVLSTYKGRLIIQEDKIVEIGVFYNLELLIEDIKGFRSDQNNFYFIPKDKSSKRIKITQHVGNKSDLTDWMFTNFENVEVIEGAREVEDILANKEFGDTTEKRKSKLKQARLVAMMLNAVGTVLGILLFFYPYPYDLLTMAALIYPIFILASLHFFKGIIRIDQKNASGYPSIIYGLLFTGGTLALRSLLDFEILDYRNFWLPAVSITGVVALVMFSMTFEFKFKKTVDYFSAVFLVGFLFMYSYGGIINYNCIYDDSQAAVYSSEILDMRISTGKMTTYYVELNPWGPETEIEEVSISEELYKELVVGETVNLYLHEGKVNIPWFLLAKK